MKRISKQERRFIRRDFINTWLQYYHAKGQKFSFSRISRLVRQDEKMLEISK